METSPYEAARNAEFRCIQQCKAIVATKDDVPAAFWLLLRLALDEVDATRKAVNAEREKKVKQIIKDRVRWLMIGGHFVPAVNTPTLQSEVGHELLAIEKDAPFSACYYANAAGDQVFSLRSEDARVDVSEVAKQYGGGGHRNAAGFKTSGSGLVRMGGL